MEELINKLNSISGTYFGFVAGIVNYAKQKPERLEKVLRFIDESDELTTSDVVKFVMMQPDFHEFGLGHEEAEVLRPSL